MARDDPQINIRIPAGLKNRLERQAAINKRSATAEIVDRLNRSFHEMKMPPKLVVRLEVLREGPAIEIPVLDFFRTMSITLRDQIAEQIAQEHETRRDEATDLDDDKRLEPAVDRRPDDKEMVERALTALAMERGEKMQRRLARQGRSPKEKPTEDDEQTSSPDDKPDE